MKGMKREYKEVLGGLFIKGLFCPSLCLALLLLFLMDLRPLADMVYNTVPVSIRVLTAMNSISPPHLLTLPLSLSSQATCLISTTQ